MATEHETYLEKYLEVKLKHVWKTCRTKAKAHQKSTFFIGFNFVVLYTYLVTHFVHTAEGAGGPRRGEPRRKKEQEKKNEKLRGKINIRI